MRQSTQPRPATVNTSWSDQEARRIEQAAAAQDYADATAFVRDAVLEAVDEVLDEDGPFECPHEDCDATFPTERQRLGHLGSDAHGLDVPDGEFWCGYCGDGPFSWRGVNAHHGSSSGHDGEPIRLDEEPTDEDLVGVDDLPDHKNATLLEELYDRYDSISELCRQHDFDVGQGTVRTWLIKFDIHEVTPHSGSTAQSEPAESAVDGDLPVYRDASRMRDLYEEHDGNLSAIARSLDGVSYSNVRTWTKKLGIHDPDAPAPPQMPDVGPEPDDYGDEDAADEPPTDDEDVDAPADESDPSDTEDISETDDPGPSPRDQLVEEISPERLNAVAPGVDPQSEVSFADLGTPDWMVEASFYVALDIAATPEEFAEKLGWGNAEDLALMVALLDDLEEFDEWWFQEFDDWRSAVDMEVLTDV